MRQWVAQAMREPGEGHLHSLVGRVMTVLCGTSNRDYMRIEPAQIVAVEHEKHRGGAVRFTLSRFWEEEKGRIVVRVFHGRQAYGLLVSLEEDTFPEPAVHYAHIMRCVPGKFRKARIFVTRDVLPLPDRLVRVRMDRRDLPVGSVVALPRAHQTTVLRFLHIGFSRVPPPMTAHLVYRMTGCVATDLDWVRERDLVSDSEWEQLDAFRIIPEDPYILK